MLLSDRDLRKELDAGRLVIDPYDPAMLQPSSIDVRLDRYFRVFDNTRYTHIDPSIQQDELTSLVEQSSEDEPFVLAITSLNIRPFRESETSAMIPSLRATMVPSSSVSSTPEPVRW